MKILFVVGGSAVSGAEIVTLTVMKGLRQRGYDIRCIVSGWNDGDFIGRLQALGISFDIIKLGFLYFSKPLWTFDTLLNLPRAWFEYCRVRKKFKPDVVYHVTFRTLFMTLPFIKRDFIIYHVHDALALSKANRFFLRAIDKKVSRYIAVSDFINRHLRKFGMDSKKIVTVLNASERMDPSEVTMGLSPRQKGPRTFKERILTGGQPLEHFFLLGRQADV